MARVTIEDCTKIVPSRFELVILAAQRAKDISAGSKITVERHNDKNAVIALREISLGHVSPDLLREEVLKKHQKFKQNELIDKPEDEDLVEDSEIANEIRAMASSAEMSSDDFYEDEISGEE